MVANILTAEVRARRLQLVRIRRAVESDIPWLRQQLQDFAAAYPVRLTVPDDHAEVVLGTLIREQYVAIAEREDEDGQPTVRVGLIAGVLGPHPFAPAMQCATQLFWWVTPEFRRSTAGARLLADFEAWVESVNPDIALFSLAANSPVHRGSLAGRGWMPTETWFARVKRTGVPA